MASLSFTTITRAMISRNVGPVRSIHSSSSVLRKNRSSQSQSQVNEEDIEEEDDFDLFDTSAPGASAGIGATQVLDKAYVRQLNLANIYQASKVRIQNKKSIKISSQALRQVVATSSEDDQVEELKKVVRVWRIAGERVSKKTAEEIVGRCVNLGRPDVAATLLSDRIQYGLPDLPQPILIKLHHSLLSSTSPSLPALPTTQPISPTLTLLRLNILQSQTSENQDGIIKNETEQLSSSPTGRKWKSTSVVDGWAEEAKNNLRAAGGVWAEAVDSIERSKATSA